jgi:transposase-like protein
LAYSTERRAAVLKKLEPPDAVPLRQLAKDKGISEATLHTWRRDARGKGRLLPDTDAGPEGWASRDEFAAVVETAAMDEAALAAYRRQRGLYAEQIQPWRAVWATGPNALAEAAALLVLGKNAAAISGDGEDAPQPLVPLRGAQTSA